MGVPSAEVVQREGTWKSDVYTDYIRARAQGVLNTLANAKGRPVLQPGVGREEDVGP